MWEAPLSEWARRRRFVRFLGVTFGVAPPEEWGRLCYDLLAVEEGLACEQTAFGCVHGFELDINVPDDVKFAHRPTPLGP